MECNLSNSRHLLKNKSKVIKSAGSDSITNIKNDEQGITKGIIWCIGGVLKRSSDDFMFHLFPPQTLMDIPSIQKQVDIIDKNTPLKG